MTFLLCRSYHPLISKISAYTAAIFFVHPPVSLLYAMTTPPPKMYSSSQIDDLSVITFPCLSDNYGYLLHDVETKQTAAIDTPEASIYENELRNRGWTLTHILNTHHHYDHTGGNMQLKTPHLKIYGPSKERDSIPGLDIGVEHGDTFSFGRSQVKVIDVGGHTKGHIAYHFPNQDMVFVGDSLFSLGCGKMFEGTAKQFWNSLKRLRELKDETKIYCGHEYTYNNGRFSIEVEPSNPHLIQRIEEVKNQLSNGKPTVPTTINQEKKTNPFLRLDVSKEIRRYVNSNEEEEDYKVFEKLRAAKDRFR